ncbi:RING zinc finger-containing protein [Reticulomyxa filosa]|uniref:RING zinc finger-containing protein n=1 Tax=Reticulomyxa filosa TaxID=46433 RepID=X6NNW0_RETFI|nr:RING zinc finger-containing protein [Reticulomyxa filosa]|eukprot:ETO27706.1 RING zinc finger-containing protein [Reticulomyxa filosa]
MNRNHKVKNNKEEVHKEEIPVPPRDVLLRMPLYSTPLTLEATNNAYRDFISRLIGMGFELEQAECAITMTNAESMETAVEFVFQHPDGLWHRFRPNDTIIAEMNKQPNETCLVTIFFFYYAYQRDDLCETCGLQYWRHFLDPNGTKIELSSLEQAPPNDLPARVTISVATRNEREEFKRELEQRVLLSQANRNVVAGSATSNSLSLSSTTTTTNPTITALLQEEANRPKPVGPTQLCGVCFDEKPEDGFYRAPCGHNYCIECLETHYRIKTQDADVLKVGCIDPNCDREIPEEEFTKFLRDPELLKKFRTFKKNKLLMLNPNA